MRVIDRLIKPSISQLSMCWAFFNCLLHRDFIFVRPMLPNERHEIHHRSSSLIKYGFSLVIGRVENKCGIRLDGLGPH